MRRLDYWVGIPVCFLLSLVHQFRLLLSVRDRRDRTPPHNVLFIELAEMGSTVLAYPAVTKLRSVYPTCTVFFLVFTHIAESVRVLNLVPDGNVLTIEATNAYTVLRDTIRFVVEARTRHIDTTINLEMFVRYSAILSYLSGARTRVGFHAFAQRGLYTGNFLTHKVAYSSHIHTWQAFMSLVHALWETHGGMPLGKGPVDDDEYVVPKIGTDAEARRHVIHLLKREHPAIDERTQLILVNPNASKLVSVRKWPLEHYARLVERLLENPACVCGITGVASEKGDADFIRGRVRSDRVIDLTGKTSLKELVDLYNVADVLITNDSGPAHFASLTDIEVVVFFGPETPELYRPLTKKCTVMYSGYACSPCVSAFNQRKSVCTDNLCLKTIDVDTVYGTVMSIMQRVERRADERQRSISSERDGTRAARGSLPAGGRVPAIGGKRCG